MSLFDFEECEAPKLNESKPIQHPEEPGVILGYSAFCENREKGRSMNIQRTRFGSGDEKQDYYRKVGGYSMLKGVVHYLRKNGVQYIFVEEVDNDRLIEYQLGQFFNGESVVDVNGYDQWCVPVDKSIHTWTLEESTINHGNRQ